MIIKQDTYKVGDVVQIVELEALRKCKGYVKEMDKYAGTVMTVKEFCPYGHPKMNEAANDYGGWCWYPDMIAGRVIDIALHDGKAYKPVARKAKPGELIQIVKEEWTGGHHKNGDIMIITDYTKPDFPFIYHFSYLTLEPIPCMTDEPHPEIAEGSTFVVVNNQHREEFQVGQIVTLTKNDETWCPYFDKHRDLMWYRLSPVNIIYKQDKAATDNRLCVNCQYYKLQVDTEPCKTCVNSGNRPLWQLKQDMAIPKQPKPVTMSDAPHPEIKPGAQFRVVDTRELGYARDGDIVTLHSNFDNSKSALFFVQRTREKHGLFWRRLVPIDTCPKQCESCKHSQSCEYGLMDCRHYEPLKRTFTPEQISEARDIVYRILTNGIVCQVENVGNLVRVHRFERKAGSNYTLEMTAQNYAECSDNYEFNRDVGICIALCKLTGEKLPDWLEV
jgi:hypothetical protein